ncbi:DUF4179 domain-containing protein [Paenibacillus sacheonensis]|uniref:DUF4179 domain-containing protein n=1 Tax=Paenibacillus sacheonensis TaxID=742054 RepID=A0A7X4YRU9_9BACL|nr:DUF4179 domain-containing protein [Paenibacillus sacheonensis]MBM7566149.1 hypothetical protein [Paenibacillus sacheonensis]NBC70359.1 DUF4179 domain-containing protein [Paenibacillus sacheonensis]
MSMPTKQTAEREFRYLEKLIRETPVHIDLTDQVMSRLYKGSLPEQVRPKKWGRAVWVAASVFALFVIVASTGLVSPVMAESLKKIPVLSSLFQAAGDLGLKTADEAGMVTKLDVADTHDGVTLQVPVAAFDGTRVSLGLERKHGAAATDTIGEQIQTIDLSINGKPVQTYAPGNSNTIGISTYPGMDKDSSIIEFSDLHNQGGRPFPDKFELSLSVYLNGIQEPFVLKIPVSKNTTKEQIAAPNVSRHAQELDFTLKKIERTPITTTISTQIAIPIDKKLTLPIQTMGIEVVDDTGKKLKLLGGNSWNDTDGHLLMTDYHFEPLLSDYKTLTIKPFYYLFQDDKHSFVLDGNGTPQIAFIPELEITVSANR